MSTRTKTKGSTAISFEDAMATARNYSQINTRLAKLKAAYTNATNTVKAKQDVALLKVKEKHEPGIKECEQALKEDFEFLKLYAKQNRNDWDNKSEDLSYAVIGFRLGQRSVKFDDAENVIKKMKNVGLKKFIRTKEEINKVAILGVKDEVALSLLAECDVTIEQEESFYVEIKD